MPPYNEEYKVQLKKYFMIQTDNQQLKNIKEIFIQSKPPQNQQGGTNQPFYAVQRSIHRYAP